VSDAAPRSNTGKLDELTVALARIEAAAGKRNGGVRLPVWLALLGAIGALVVTLGTLGLFTLEPATRTQVGAVSARVEKHDAAIKVLEGTVGQIDVTTWRLWCWQQFPGSTREQKGQRRECESAKPAVKP
jgi:hypothetical protein